MYEKYSSSIDELQIQQEEIERLNVRIKSQSNDKEELQAFNDRLNDQITFQNKQTQQFQYEIEMFKQEVNRQEKLIENLKTEKVINTKNSKEDIESIELKCRVVNEESQHLKNELDEMKKKFFDLKVKTTRLTDQLDSKTNDYERVLSDLEKFKKICNDQESKLCQNTTEKCLINSRLEKSNQQLFNLNNKIEGFKMLNQNLETNINNLKKSLDNSNQQVNELNSKLSEKENTISLITAEKKDLQADIDEEKLSYKKLNETNRTMNGEMDKLNEDIAKLLIKTAKDELEICQLQTKLADQKDAMNELENNFKNCENEFKNYQQKFKYTSDDIALRENSLNKVECDLDDMANKLQVEKMRNHELCNENAEIKIDLDSLAQKKAESEKEINRLEDLTSDLQIKLKNVHQKSKKEISQLELNAQNFSSQLENVSKEFESMSHKINVQNDFIAKLENQIDNANKDVKCRNIEIDDLKLSLKNSKEMISNLESVNREKENKILQQINQIEQTKCELNDSIHQLQKMSQDKLKIEEKFVLACQNNENIQDDIRLKVQELVRTEQLCQKQQTEIKTLKERTRSYEEEINEMKSFIDRLKKDYVMSRDELNANQQDILKWKNTILRLEGELKSNQDKETLMADQVTNNEKLINTLKSDLKAERNKQQDCQKSISQLKQTITELNNNIDLYDNQFKELTLKLKDKETKILSIQHELNDNHQKNNQLNEENAQKDGQIKLLEMKLQNNDKQMNHLTNEIEKYEEAMTKFKSGIEKAQTQYRECNVELLQSQQHINDLKLAISTSDTNHHETLHTMAEKTKENILYKEEIVNLKLTNQSFVDQINKYDDKYKQIKLEFKRLQDESEQNRNKIKLTDQQTHEMTYQLSNLEQLNAKLSLEIHKKDEENSVIKCDFKNLQDAYKVKHDEV
jgi:chromosome segregation ATPase